MTDQKNLFTKRYSKVKAPEPSEAQIQKALVQQLQWRRKEWEGRVVWWHTPNGGWRHKITAITLRLMGVKPGVPDLIFIFKTKDGTEVLFLELKSRKGVVSDAQAEFANSIQQIGCLFEVANSLDGAVKCLTDYGS